MRLIWLLLLAVLALAGCNSGADPGAKPASNGQPGAAPIAADKKTVAELRAERDKLLDQLAAKDQEISKAVVARRQKACHWLQAGLGALGIVCGALGWLFRPLLWRFLAASAACVVLVIALGFVAWLAPWWPWIGAGVLLLTAGLGVLYWQRDHRTAGQIVAAIEEWKAQGTGAWATLKPHLASFTDQGVKDWIEKLVPASPLKP